MKKILLIIFSIISIFLVYKVNAEELPTFEVGSYNAFIGEEITIPISLKNNQNCAYLGLKISYDTNSLEYIDSHVNGLKNATMKGIKINDNNIITLYALTTSHDTFIDDNGIIAEITFKVKENAKDTTFETKVTDYGTDELEEIPHNIINGQIIIYDKVTEKDNINVNEIIEKDKMSKDWEISNHDIAEIDENGQLTFKKEGEVTITGTDSEGNIITKKYKYVNNEKTSSTEKKLSSKTIIITTIIVIIIISAILIFIIFKKK